MIETAHQEAYETLRENRDVLDALVVELLDRETLDKSEVEEVFAPLRKRQHRPVWLSSSERPVSERGPVKSRKEVDGDGLNGAAVDGAVEGAEANAGDAG